MAKDNIRSIRFTDEIAEIIDQQQGKNFTEKFERLVYNCYMLQNEKAKELERLDNQIQEQKERLNHIRAKADKLKREQTDITLLINRYHTSINIALNSIEEM